MTHNLLYRIPDTIYQTFFCAKVLLHHLPPQYCQAPQISESDSSSVDSNPTDTNFEYYLENNYNQNHNNTSVDGIMITRSAWKKINQGLPDSCQLEPLEPIPKIIIKKKSIKGNTKKKFQPSLDSIEIKEPVSKTPSLNYVKKSKKKSYRYSTRNACKAASIKLAAKRLKHIDNIIPEVTGLASLTSPPHETTSGKSEPQSAELSTRTAETGYSSAADSTTNEPGDAILKPILNYTVIPKPKKGRHSKSCCLDFVILPPTEPITPSKVIPIVKLPRGRPRNLSGRSKAKPKVVGGVKKPRKQYMTKRKLAAFVNNPQSPQIIESQSGVPGRSLPIIEGPPNMTRAAWIKEQLMKENLMCRIPLSKISRIPHVIKIKIPSIAATPSKSDKTTINNNHATTMIPKPEPSSPPEEPKIESASVSGITASETTKGATGTTIEAINDWFPNDLDLSSLNETDMVLEDQYFLKNKSFTSTPCPNQQTEPIETYMTEKLATEALPDISFGSTFFNYTDSGLVTPIIKQQIPPTPAPPPLSPPEIFPAAAAGDDENYIQITIDDKPEILDFSFKRPFNKQIFPIAAESSYQNSYTNSPASEPLDLSVRKNGRLQNISESCSQNTQYAPCLSPQAEDDVLLLDCSYQAIECTPRCNSGDRIDNFISPAPGFDHRTTNDKMKNFFTDMDAMVREQDRAAFANQSQIMSRDSTQPVVRVPNLFQNHEKIFSELNKITRTMRLNNESDTTVSHPEHNSMRVVRDGTPVVAIEQSSSFLVNGTLDEKTLNRRVLKIFGFPCFRFLNGKCITFPCRFSHQLMDARVLETILTSEPVCVIEKCYGLIVQHHMLFIQYFESFCILFGKRQMIRSLISMIDQCERFDRPIGFLRHIITGLGLCKLDKAESYALLVKNIDYKSSRTIDVLIEIMIELDVVLQFTENLELFLKSELYRINVDLFDRLLGVGKRTRNPELIRILLETINSYPSDCQKRLNSTVLTQFLQMVRSLRNLQN